MPNEMTRNCGMRSRALLIAAMLMSQPLLRIVLKVRPTVGTGCLPRGGAKNLSDSTLFGINAIGVCAQRFCSRSDTHGAITIFGIGKAHAASNSRHVAPRRSPNLIVLHEVELCALARREAPNPLRRLPPSGDDDVRVGNIPVSHGPGMIEPSNLKRHAGEKRYPALIAAAAANAMLQKLVNTRPQARSVWPRHHGRHLVPAPCQPARVEGNDAGASRPPVRWTYESDLQGCSVWYASGLVTR